MRFLISIRFLLVGLLLSSFTLIGCGLNDGARQELSDAGVDKYIGEFTPISSTDVGDGWTKHTFDTDGGNGPICIAGTSFSAFTRAGNPSKLLIFEQGGGNLGSPALIESRDLKPLPTRLMHDPVCFSIWSGALNIDNHSHERIIANACRGYT